MHSGQSAATGSTAASDDQQDRRERSINNTGNDSAAASRFVGDADVSKFFDIPSHLFIENPEDSTELLMIRFPAGPGAEERTTHSNTFYANVVADKWDLPSIGQQVAAQELWQRRHRTTVVNKVKRKIYGKIGRMIGRVFPAEEQLATLYQPMDLFPGIKFAYKIRDGTWTAVRKRFAKSRMSRRANRFAVNLCEKAKPPDVSVAREKSGELDSETSAYGRVDT